MKCLALIAVLVTQGVLSSQAPATGAITGQILSLDGKPAIGVRVAAALPNANGQITAETLVAITKTNETGHYRLDDVPAGRYGIVAGVVGSPTFYPGTADNTGAAIVLIAPGSTAAGLDFRMLPPPVVALHFYEPGSKGAVLAELAARYERAKQQDQQRLQNGLILSGRVVVEGPARRRETNLRLLFAGSDRGMPLGRVNVSAYVQVDGTFNVTLEPNDLYTISLARLNADGKPERLDEHVIESIKMGSQDLSKEGLKLIGPVMDEIVVTLVP